MDSARGLVLTNRHVVTPGPIVAEGIFQNHEEVELRPVYYDPIHDFGCAPPLPAQAACAMFSCIFWLQRVCNICDGADLF